MQNFEGILGLISPFVIVAVISIFWVSLYLKSKNRNPQLIQGTAILLGVFFTFAGVVWALLGFDPENLNASIFGLLNGIKPAFVSSVVGMLVALSVNLFPKFWKQDEEKLKDDTDEIDTEALILQELKNLNTNIMGDSKDSLNAQILGLKNSFNTKQDELKKSFDTFAEKMAENNMKALEEVIKDFNNKLQEQFGENFKQLNIAVGELLEWQKGYKQTIESTNETLNTAIESFKSSKESLEISATSLEKLTESADSFKNNSEALKEQLEEVRNNISSLSDFAQQLEGKGDEISEEMKKITESSLQELGQNLKGISEAIAEDYKSIQDAFNKIRKVN